MKVFIVTARVFLCSILVFLRIFDFIGLWSEGIGYIIDGNEKFAYQNMIIEGDYEIDIDLANLDANKNKVVYDDGGCKIIIDSIDNTGEVNTGGYRVHFSAIGKYSVNGAELVSGVSYQYSNNGISTDLAANLNVLVNGRIYECSQYGLGSDKGGNNFSFYLFPSELYMSGEVTLEEQGTAAITLSNLSKNIWTRK